MPSPPYLSPLRYPGGKASLAPYLGWLISSQPERCRIYVEPFAGGAGAALRLLFDEYVEAVVLNDLDPGIAGFWRAVLAYPDEFVHRVMTVELSIEEWQRQRAIYKSAGAEDMELGFAAFYLNRTNRSGILTARPIGGLGQTGGWLLNARFNRKDLARRIQLVARYKNRITVEQADGAEFLKSWTRTDRKTFVYVDPPYLSKSGDLYLDPMEWADHCRLAELLRDASVPWMLTYDEDPRVTRDLYPGWRCARFAIAHTAAKQHVGTEYAIFGSNVRVTSLEGLGSEAVTVTPRSMRRWDALTA